MLKTIENIISVIGRKRIGNINILNPSRSNSSIKNQLYYKIIDKKVTTDSEAASFLGFKNKSEKAYLMSMGRFRDQLMNLLFFLDPKYSYPNKFTRDKILCLKHFMFGKILLFSGSQILAQKEYQKSIRFGLKSDFVSIIELSMLDYIRIGSRISRGSFLKQYVMEFEKIQKWALSLKKSEYYLSMIFELMSKNKAISKNLNKTTKDYVDIIDTVSNPFKDIRIREIKFLANAYYFQRNSEFEKLLLQVNSYWDFISSSEKARLKHKKECLRFSLISHLFLKKYEGSKKIYEENRDIFNKDSQTYINFTEFFFLTCMHTKKYEKAGELLYEVFSNSFFYSLPPESKERWLIYEAFFMFSIESATYRNLFSKKRQKYMLRVNSFLNKKPLQSKEKEGLNTQILISQYLHLLIEKKYDEIIDKINALKIYNYRYLKKQDNSAYLRTYYFIKILITISKHSFNKTLSIKHSKKYLDKLKNVSGPFTDNTRTIEVIPYEDLWLLILEILE